MVLRKQSIRNIDEVTINGLKTTKDEILHTSMDWVEKEIILFKKVLSQGGTCKIRNNTFRVSKIEPIRTVAN
tara:strand:+ start:453 stop:668 length:216 start_codon:yes stop_codon:yes gene_type:complete